VGLWRLTGKPKTMYWGPNVTFLDLQQRAAFKTFKLSQYLCLYIHIYIYIWLRVGRSGDRIPVRVWFFTHVQTGSGVHPASCTMGTGSFRGGKTAGAWCWPPTPFQRRGHERVQPYLYPPSRPVQACNWTALPLYIYVIKKSLCTWCLQYKKHAKIF
jgi:hypothetical protein